MLSLPPSVRIYFGTEPMDMRKGIDGLRAHVQAELGKDPFDGHLFVFVGKRRDRVKILFWDRNGFVLYLKRLERGRFQQPVLLLPSSVVDGDSRRLSDGHRCRGCRASQRLMAIASAAQEHRHAMAIAS